MCASANSTSRRTACGTALTFALAMCVAVAAAATVASAAEPTPHTRAAKAGNKSCADAVAAYLKQAVTRRAAVVTRASQARAALNEARSVLAEEKDGQRAATPDAKRRVKAAWSAFEVATAAVQKFDEATLKRHGGLPQQCIQEVELRRAADSDTESLMGRLQIIAEIMLLHARLYWETVRGVYRYSAVEYREVLQAYDETSTFFGALSRTVYDEIQLHKKNRGFDDESSGLTETLALALLHLKSVTYMVLPWMTVVAGVVLFSLFGPFILSAVVIPNLVWRVWVQLFVLHHTYGLTVDGFLISLREWADMLLSKDWAGLQERFMAALISLAADGGVGTFYNGIIAMSLVVATVICLLYLMYIWVKVPLMLLVSEFSGEEDTVIIKMKKDRPAGRDSGDGKGPSKGVIRQSTKMTTPPRSSGGAGGNSNTNNNNNDASERNRKKKA